MSNIICVDRIALPANPADSQSLLRVPRAFKAPRGNRLALLASCALAGGALVVATGTAAMAGCYSGTSNLMQSYSCQAFPSPNGTAVGFASSAAGLSATAFGSNATAAAGGGVALGVYSKVTGNTGIAIGSAATADGDFSIAIGGAELFSEKTLASSPYAIAIGTSAIAKGSRTVSVGTLAGTNGGANNDRNSAFGAEAGRFVTGDGNIAAGLAAGHTVKGNLNSALGNSAGQAVTGNNNLAGGILSGTTVVGSFNVGYGDNAGRDVTGNGNIAIGQNAGRSVKASGTVAIGINARASENNAIAIGNSSVADVPGTVSVGRAGSERRIVNVAKATKPTDAVNFAQVQALVAAMPVAAPSTGASGAGLKQLIDELRQEVTDLRALVHRQQREIAARNGRDVAVAGAVAD